MFRRVGNNAGIGVVGAFEATAMPTVREVFDTNAFGTLAMCKAVIPQMRERQSGVIVNVTSSVTLANMTFAAAYTGSKAAVEGFTGSLVLGLGAFGVRVKLVEPEYGPSTRFIGSGIERMQGSAAGYARFSLAVSAAALVISAVFGWLGYNADRSEARSQDVATQVLIEQLRERNRQLNVLVVEQRAMKPPAPLATTPAAPASPKPAIPKLKTKPSAKP